MTATRRRRRRDPSWGGRKRFNLGPTWARYYRNYSARVSADGVRGGFTSHGWRVHIPKLGPLSHNMTTDEWSWDTRGWGALRWAGRFRDVFAVIRGRR